MSALSYCFKTRSESLPSYHAGRKRKPSY